MDSRNVNFSIKKSQIHTHMLGLPQKLTKLEIALKTSIALDLGLVPKNWPWNKLLFTLFTAKAPPGGHWWNRGLGPKFTNEVLTYLIKKNLIKITLLFSNHWSWSDVSKIPSQLLPKRTVDVVWKVLLWTTKIDNFQMIHKNPNGHF